LILVMFIILVFFGLVFIGVCNVFLELCQVGNFRTSEQLLYVMELG